MNDSPEQLHRQFVEAFNRHDLEALVALYEPDAVLVTEPLARGTEAIREALRGYLALRPTMDLQTVKAVPNGDIALLHGKWTLHGTAPDGSEVHVEGRNTETARRQADGRWLFLIDNPYSPVD